MLKISEKLENGEVLDVLSDFTSMHRALGWMLYATHKSEEPGIVETYADGILNIFEHHSDLLDGITDAVGIKLLMLDEYRGEVEALTNAKKGRSEVARRMREEFISAKAKEGASPSDIASAVNGKEAEIEAVIAALNGRAGTDRARASGRA